MPASRPCSNGCGWSAFQSYASCCRSCSGPEGPHGRDCAEKNTRVRPACSQGCGRPAFESYRTCCVRCRGPGSSHNEDCAEKCRTAAAAAPPLDPGAKLLGATDGTFRPSGRRRALLIGINYRGTRAELRGCVNDVGTTSSLLVERFGWGRDCIRRLTDDGATPEPTRRNIEDALQWLVEGARPGDALFFHFSGHGAQEVDPNGYEENGMNETILPVDFKHAGMISDDRISDLIVKPLPEGVRLTALLDCCHSGTGLDLPFKLSKSVGWREETNPYHSAADVRMFSGCADEGTSADMSSAYGAAGGAMTTAFSEVLRAHSKPGYVDFMKLLYENLRSHRLKQRPLLSSTQRFDIDRQFALDDICPNSNPKLGRTVRKKFEPQPRITHGPLAELLGLGVALIAQCLDGRR